MFEHLDDPRPPRLDGRFRRGVADRARRRRRRRRLAGGAGVATVTLVAGVGGLYGRAAWRAGDVDRLTVAGTGEVAAGAPLTVLVAGVDAHGRRDALVLARIDPAAGTAALLSIPRDLVVEPHGGGDPVMTNAIDDRGELVATVEATLGVPVDHYAEVSFDGLAELVDRIGGIDVRVDVPVRDLSSGLVLPDPGCVTLDGERALALARSRKIEAYDAATGTWLHSPLADLGRVELQRQLLAAALAGVADEGVGPVALDRLAGWLADNVAVDAALGRDDMVALLGAALALDPADLFQSTLPVVPHPADVNRLALDTDRVPAAVAAFLAGEAPPDAGALGRPADLPGGAVVDPC